MDFTYDDEQVALRDAVRGLATRAYGDFEQRRRTVAEDPGFSEKVWTQLAEMGVLGLPFPEEVGGVDAGPVEVGIVAAELGRVLAPEPFLTSVVLAGGLVAAAGTAQQQADVLGPLSAGESILAFAHNEPWGNPGPAARWVPTASTVTASDPDGTWLLSGVKEPVAQGARADLLVVSAALPAGGTGLFLVPGDGPGVSRTGHPTYDGGRAARIAFDGAPATRLGAPGVDQSATISAAVAHARVAACHEALGAMEVALSATTEYLRTRKQFGVPLATFQALTFRAADMYVSLELARSLTQWAAMVLATGDRERGTEAAARAGLQVSRSGRHIGQEAIQLHGGIAMTAEYLVGNLTARLTALDHLLGDGHHHLTTLAAGVGGYGALDPLAGRSEAEVPH
ncbi:acyl-CoA dehydrogenase family protein [Nocardioides sp. zg-DK7169]|uniref:acyl-CoA dehydrogenase family protein n=1 Tax=Nocardioides sp. zg-DK7169 TaxID=2736600 RepID=UPI001556E205|nr:acyl-CoA dehydrogenase family protein [Nocardioides sp. zg-DK7169]NPC97999.1 acyl-CoA dehydrogenase [Nocardioides sp. zg-DK7169]